MKRRLASEIAVQSLYQMEMNEVDGAAEAVHMVINEAAEDNETEVLFAMRCNAVLMLLSLYKEHGIIRKH